jgi:prolyl 4-hydroxylase
MTTTHRKQNPTLSWIDWLGGQIRLGTDMALIEPFLRGKGIPDDAVAAALESVRPRDSALVDGRLEPPPLIRRAPPQLRKLDAPGLDLFAYDGFMSRKDCERLIALVGHHLGPSPLAKQLEDGAFRTSRTCALAYLRSPVALEVDAKICRTIGIRAEYGEGIQAQRYDVGQQFKPHWDYFEPGSDEYRRLAALRGNRTWTFMVYLNDGMEGGATRFMKNDFAVVPKTGMALLWNNLLPDGTPNPDVMHCGEPVIRGHKVIITKWFRVNGDGPVHIE